MYHYWIGRFSMYANDSMEQLTWDSILLKGWATDAPIRNLIWMLDLDFKQDIIYKEVRRFPQAIFKKMGTRVFVARYLPKLSEKLWDDVKQSDILFWLMMHGEKLSVEKKPTDAKKFREESYMRKQTSKKIVQAITKNVAISKLYASHRRTEQWSTCK